MEVQVPVRPARSEMEPTLTGDCMLQKGLDRALAAETATADSAEAATATADLAEAVSATADTEAVPATADTEVVSWMALHLGKVQ